MQPQNQTVLTLIVALALSSAFIGVFALDYQYDQTTEIDEVWASDSNLEFSNIDMGLLMPDIAPITMGLGSYMFYGFPTYTSYTATNSTGVYLENETWGGSMIGWSEMTPDFTSAAYFIPIDIPIAKITLIKDIYINISLPATPIHMSIGLSGYTDPQTTIQDAIAVSLANTVPYDGTTLPYYKATYHLTTYQSLTWFNMCQKEGVTPYIGIYMYDLARDGMPSYAMTVQMNMTGGFVNTWSLQDSVNVVVGASFVGNIALCIYMTDAIDWNNLRRKDLNKGR